MKLAALLLTAATTITVLHGGDTYQKSGEIAIGGEGGWDTLTIDDASHLLYLSHATKFVVVDLEKNSVAGEITDTPGAHGLAIFPDLRRGYTSNGKENKSSVVDLATLKTLSKVETGQNPDIVLYEPSQKEIYCFNAKGNSATIINAATGAVTTTVALPGNPEFAACDPAAGQVYVNIENLSTVAVIDTKTHTITANWPIAPGKSASGIAIDREHHRLFLGCDNKLMVMMDSTNGKVSDLAPIGEHIDGVAFDPATQLAFASGGDGTTTILHEDTPNKLTVIQSLATEKGARTMALDEATHKIYLPSAQFETEAAPAAGEQHHRPNIVPNTFKVLVYSPVGK